MIRPEDVFAYHSGGRPGKIQVVPTKPLLTQRDLSLAYTPGVAQPCLEIQRDPELAFAYTAKGNLVAVVSNGTAVLGLGAIGAQAGKPVMEGKGCLFKKFADIDVFDLEVDSLDPDELINIVAKLEPTFGGINLEDIKAPECFYIEEQLKRRMGIPVFHDDQHGTAIISGAALLNAAELQGKPMSELKLVVSGAGAAGIACTRFFVTLGVKKENVILCDSTGVIYEGRAEGMNPYKAQFASHTRARTLAQAFEGADVFLGYSVGGTVTPAMVQSMADRPIVFALANPTPEISYEEARASRPDVIVATGRSDFPNQVNNVLGFPAIFRGALDVQAREINEAMMVAAAHALASLAREEVPASVQAAYGGQTLRFGPDYIIPKPFDPRVLTWEAPAVAQAAMETGVARRRVDLEAYRLQLEDRVYGRVHLEMRKIRQQARQAPKWVVFPEGESETILRAVRILVDEGLARPILLGRRSRVEQQMARLGLEFGNKVEVLHPSEHPRFEEYCRRYSELRARRGVTLEEAHYRLRASRTHYAMMMLRELEVDAAVLGLTTHYPEALRPVLEVIGLRPGVTRACSMHMLVLQHEVKFFADCTVNVDPTAEQVAEIALLTAEKVAELGVTPRLAMISFSNFGSSPQASSRKMARATELVRAARPELEVDGEMQVDVALDFELQRRLYPFCRLTGPANTLVFPNLDTGQSCYKMMSQLGHAEVVGPILLGLERPVEVMQRADSVDAVVRMAALATVSAQRDPTVAAPGALCLLPGA